MAESWASQAALNALVKYAPQQQALAQLKRAAEEKFQGSVQAGRTEGTLGAQAAHSAVAPTEQIFNNAQEAGARGQSLVAPILAALSANSPFRAAAANEQAAGSQRLEQSRASALSDLQQRGVAARELPAFTRQAAMATLAKELLGLQQKGSALQGTQAADVQSEIDRLRAEGKKDALTERGQNLTHQSAEAGHQTSERNSERTAASRAAALAAKGGAGVKPLGTKETDAAVAEAAEIRQLIGKAPGHSRAEYVAKLMAGEPEQSVNKVKVPAIKAYRPTGVMAAALDWSEHGHMTKNTEARLEREGYDPAKLGVPRAPSAAQERQQEAAAKRQKSENKTKGAAFGPGL